jgi:adenylate cyclase
MPSLIEGYNYDIFISYRQKDNKGDMWVSEFVESLKTELESTFKEEISVYFDINPHDGLLETHDVDESLKEKLRCLVFIPIISRTYCDTKSFAWEHEFKAFIEQALKDQYGLKVKLPGGNVGSRVLPVQIHDLDFKDHKECESVLGSVIRGVEFIYKESGVNRPLTPKDNEEKNLNKTNYRNQVNKVSLAIKEIMSGLKGEQIIYEKDQEEVGSTLEAAKSIAVLPFADMSPEKDQEYFCDGIAEEIIHVLSQIENLKVIARSSAFSFKNRQVDLREIGRILDVETILEGSIRKSGEHLRITTQLININDGSHIWSERYDRDIKDVFDIQDEISQAVANKLKVRLLSNQITLKQHSEDIEAYSLYLKGMYYWQLFTAEGYRKAAEYFDQALQIDPDYALAYIGFGYVISMSMFWGNIPPSEGMPKVKEYVDKALRIDNTLADAYALLGNLNTYYYWNWKEAEKYFQRALQINPNLSQSHLYYSLFLTFTGRHEEAIYEAKQAQQLDPLSIFINTYTGTVFDYTGLRDNAIEVLQMTLSINPDFFIIHYHLGRAYAAKGMIKESIEEYERAVDLSDETSSLVMAALTFSYYRIGETDKAERLFELLKKRSETEYVPATSLYLIHRVRGEEEIALDFLKKACDEHDLFLVWFRSHPFLIPEGSKYMQLLKEVGLDY